MNKKALLISIGSILVIAILGNIFIGDALTSWYLSLTKPWFLVPLWFFIVIGIIYYIMGGTLLYRAQIYINDTKSKSNSILLIYTMLVANEIWNYIFFGLRNLFLGFIGLIAFFLIAVILSYTLRKNDKISFYIILPYLFWLIYDLIWTYALFIING